MTDNSTDPQKKYWVVIFIIVPIVVTLIALLPTFFNKKEEISGGNITIGISLKDHEESLRKREKEIQKDLRTAHEAEKKILSKELSDVYQKLGSLEESYKQRIKYLQERTAALVKLAKNFSEETVRAAQQALQEGDESKADDLFRQIEKNSATHIKQAAEAAYQRGLIAEQQLRFFDSQRHLERATQLAPDDPAYMLSYATSFLSWALVNSNNNREKGIKFLEKSLTLNEIKNGQNHKDQIKIHRILGNSYYSINNFNQAIIHYEKGIQIINDLKDVSVAKTALFYRLIGDSKFKNKEYPSADHYYKISLDIYSRYKDQPYPEHAIVLERIGDLNKEISKTILSFKYYEDSINEYLKNKYPSDRILRLFYKTSFLYLDQGNAKKFFEFYKKAYLLSIKGYNPYPDGTFFGNYELIIKKIETISDLKIYIEMIMDLFVEHSADYLSLRPGEKGLPIYLVYMSLAERYSNNSEYKVAYRLVEKAISFQRKYFVNKNHTEIKENEKILLKLSKKISPDNKEKRGRIDLIPLQ